MKILVSYELLGREGRASSYALKYLAVQMAFCMS